MSSLLTIASPASAQPWEAVEQCWEDRIAPAASSQIAAGADVLMYQTLALCATGTTALADDRSQIVTQWYNPAGSGSCVPVVYDTRAWSRTSPHESVARRVVATEDAASPITKTIFWVGGKQTRTGDEVTSWEAVVLPYRYINGEAFTPSDSQVYLLGDDTERDYEVVAMSSINSTVEYGPLAVALVRLSSLGISPPSSAIVVLRPVWDGSEMNIEEVLLHPLAWVATDVHAEYRSTGSGEVIRIWAVGHSPPGWRSSIRVAQVDLGTIGEPDAHQYEYRIADHHVLASRFVLGPGDGDDPDLFIAGAATPSLGGSPSDMLTIRFGKTGSNWGFKWHAQYASDGDAIANDIGVVLGPTITGPNPPPGPDTFIFVAGQSQQQIGSNPPVFKNDFTTLCYREPTGGSPVLHWDAKHVADGGDDRAFRLLAASETTTTPGKAVAIVAGVAENTSGHWDWQVVKYDDDNPSPNSKEPVWSISFPVHYSSMGDDAPASMTAGTFSGVLDLQHFWLTGSSFHTTNGHEMTTVQYVQFQP